MRFMKAFGLVMLVAPAVAAQPLTVEDLGRINGLGTVLKFSPDGRYVAYEVRNWNLTAASYGEFSRIGTPPVGLGAAVWIVDTQSGQARNLTPNQGNHWGPSWSPDGKYLAFYSDRNGKPQLWLWDMSKSTSRLVTGVIVRPYQSMDTARWTADGKKVLVKLVPEGMSIEELDKLTSPDAERNQTDIGKSAGPTVTVYSSKDSKNAAQSQTKKNALAEVMMAPYLCDLALVDIANGKVERIGHRMKPSFYEISPMGGQIAFAEVKGMAEGGGFQFRHELSVFSMADHKTRVVARGVRIISDGLNTTGWSPNGESLAFTDGPDPTTSDCYVVNVSSGGQRLATKVAHPSFLGDGLRPPLWTANGQSLYLLGGDALWTIDVASGAAREMGRVPGKRITELIATARDAQVWSPDGGASVVVMTLDNSTRESGFYRIDTTTGASHKLIEEAKIFRNNGKVFLHVSSDGKRLVYVAQDTAHPDDVWITSSDFQDARRLTNINPQLNSIPMRTAKLVEWKTSAGTTLHGALLLPSNFREGERCPLLVDVYGGELLSNRLNRFGMGTNFWHSNRQIFATRGYAVLEPDLPLNVGSPMRDIAQDVIPAVKQIIDMGIADPDRIGVMGSGYGGYSVLALLVQTKLFKAAVIHAGEGDLFSVYGTLDDDGEARSASMAENGEFRMGGTPWEYRDRYFENSPFFYLDRVETPLLITHGTTDRNVPTFLGEQIFVGLRRLGTEVTYAKYKGEGLHFSSYANSADWLNRILAWFDDHLKAPSGAR